MFAEESEVATSDSICTEYLDHGFVFRNGDFQFLVRSESLTKFGVDEVHLAASSGFTEYFKGLNRFSGGRRHCRRRPAAGAGDIEVRAAEIGEVLERKDAQHMLSIVMEALGKCFETASSRWLGLEPTAAML